MAASGVLSSCASPKWNSERPASSHSSSATCRGNWWPLYSRARRSNAVASSATGITPAIAALPLSVCRARCRLSLTGVSWPSAPCKNASRLSRWPCASLRKISSNCGSRPSMSAAGGASFSASACRCPASCSISVSCGNCPAAKSDNRSGRCTNACCKATTPSGVSTIRPSSMRLSKCSAPQASSATASACTIRPLPLSVCSARRTSSKASRCWLSARQRNQWRSISGSSSPASSRNTSRSSSSMPSPLSSRPRPVSLTRHVTPSAARLTRAMSMKGWPSASGSATRHCR
ncbi:hypothetical protein D3C76_625100 [compost metagenome]